jgi:fumarate reductase flavoprotein subunit
MPGVPGEGSPEGGAPGAPGAPGEDGPGMPSSFFCADTLEELSKKTGIDYAGLKATIENYNQMCADGFDREFFKLPDEMIPFGNGPFYAMKGELATDGAFGGIQIDKDTRAYADPVAKKVVEGLYVPGDFSASRFLNYNGVKVQVINDLAWAISSGFSAAEAAVADLNP